MSGSTFGPSQKTSTPRLAWKMLKAMDLFHAHDTDMRCQALAVSASKEATTEPSERLR